MDCRTDTWSEWRGRSLAAVCACGHLLQFHRRPDDPIADQPVCELCTLEDRVVERVLGEIARRKKQGRLS